MRQDQHIQQQIPALDKGYPGVVLTLRLRMIGTEFTILMASDIHEWDGDEKLLEFELEHITVTANFDLVLETIGRRLLDAQEWLSPF